MISVWEMMQVMLPCTRSRRLEGVCVGRIHACMNTQAEAKHAYVGACAAAAVNLACISRSSGLKRNELNLLICSSKCCLNTIDVGVVYATVSDIPLVPL